MKPLLFTLAAAVLAIAAPAVAQHSHGGMHAEPSGASPTGAHGIAEGTLKDGVRTVEIAVTDEGFAPSKVKANPASATG